MTLSGLTPGGALGVGWGQMQIRGSPGGVTGKVDYRGLQKQKAILPPPPNPLLLSHWDRYKREDHVELVQTSEMLPLAMEVLSSHLG